MRARGLRRRKGGRRARRPAPPSWRAIGALRAVRRDDVGRVVDEAQRFVEHRQRRRRVARRERRANVDEILPQPLLVGFCPIEFGDEAIDSCWARRGLSVGGPEGDPRSRRRHRAGRSPPSNHAIGFASGAVLTWSHRLTRPARFQLAEATPCCLHRSPCDALTVNAERADPVLLDRLRSLHDRARSAGAATRLRMVAVARGFNALRAPSPAPAETTGTGAFGDSALVLERKLHARTVGDDFAFLDFHVELRHLGDAQVAQRLARRCHAPSTPRLPTTRHSCRSRR